MSERERFEAWARESGFDIVRFGTVEYEVSSTEFAWMAWQARAALASSAVEQTASDAVDVRASVLEEAALKVESLREKISDQLIIGFDAWSAGHNALENAAGHIRALKMNDTGGSKK